MKKNGKLAIALAVLTLLVSAASAQLVATDFVVNDTSGDPNTYHKFDYRSGAERGFDFCLGFSHFESRKW